MLTFYHISDGHLSTASPLFVLKAASWKLNVHPGMECHTNFLLPSSLLQMSCSLSSSPYCLSLWPSFLTIAHTHTNTLCVSFPSMILQNVWCGRPTLREKEVDSLFWRSHSHYLLCCTECLWPGAGWGWRDGKEKSIFCVLICMDD